MDWNETGLDPDVVQRYIDEQIYTLPGIENPPDAFTILLTGSRASGTYNLASDVDLDVLCPPDVFDQVLAASLEAGIIQTPKSFFVLAPDEGWERYYGAEAGRPHFTVTSLAQVESHFRDYDDVWIWIWTHSRSIEDPGGQFERIRTGFDGYPRDVLIRKIKYHKMLANYWSIEVSPHNHGRADDMLQPASAAIINTVTDLARLCFLVENQPFPYIPKLMRLAPTTVLGRKIVPTLRRAVDLVVGREQPERDVWERLDEAFGILNCGEEQEECRRLDDAVETAMVEAGVDADWVKADFANIDELLHGELGPVP